jgi:ABC-type sugar transport system ATPase subunit
VHSLVGKNGAGKSTLVNVISGVRRQDTGKIWFEGEEISRRSIYERQKSGIRMVTQHANVIPYMNVAENIAVGMWPTGRIGLIDRKELEKQATQALEEYRLDVDPKSMLANLDPVIQRKVNIIRALFGGGKIVILDEPTTSLTSADRDNLFEFVNRLKRTGVSFIFISHYLDEVLKLSPDPENITVIRDGTIVSMDEEAKNDLSGAHLAHLLAGENVALTKRMKPNTDFDGAYRLTCEDLTGSHLEKATLRVKKGEIVGLVGFPHSGAQELCRTLYGLSKSSCGNIVIDGKRVRIRSARDALANGIVYVSNDRHKEGVVEMHSVRENVGLSVLSTKLRGKNRLLSNVKEKELANDMVNMLSIKVNSIEDRVLSLSGGNQQKVVVAKMIASDPKLLILHEPTIGIDIKSREEILLIVNEKTRSGVSVLYLTNDYEELVRISDRLVFFHDGRVTDIVENEGISAAEVIEIRDAKKGEAKNVQ